ncbi:MAG: class I SAM-dependent methyltransferase [Permianibacter sp.]
MSAQIESQRLPVRDSVLTQRCRRAVLDKLSQLQGGSISVHEEGQHARFGDADAPLHAELHILHPDAWAEIALGGSIGAAESYMNGDWRCNDLTSLVQIFARNLDLLDQMESKVAFFTNLARKGLHWWRRNSQSQARKNIAAHYDLGNDMFQLWLDPLMMYSSAIYPSPDSTLDTAARHKLQRIGEKLQLGPNDHLLEIGTGWGGLSVYLAQTFGCKVTTTTISKEQHALARERIDAAGLGDRIELLLEDYRDLNGQYDKLVSVEMIEAVGLQYLPQYFRKCSSLLKANGAFLLQSITIADQRYDYAAKNVDFIQRYIFPGGALPSNTRIGECLRDATDLRLVHHEDIGLHYARTLKDWRDRFHHKLNDIRALGYDERFIRMWEYYLCYCEGGFRERVISCAQMLMHKPRCIAALP